jgi:hypothetical protein
MACAKPFAPKTVLTSPVLSAFVVFAKNHANPIANLASSAMTENARNSKMPMAMDTVRIATVTTK